MGKGTRKQTRKIKKSSNLSNKHVLTIPQLRKAFDHMDKVVEHLRKIAKHSFSDAVVSYREEWRKTFKRDLPPADAAAYLKFRYGLKTGKTRRSKTRGGAMAGSSGAPLDYQLRAGVSGAYGNFPSYQSQGLDRYYGSAITADCRKPNGFPTDGSYASQAGGGFLDGLFRPIGPTAPPGMAYTAMMTDPGKGTTAYPSSDPVGFAPFRPVPNVFTNPTFANTPLRTYSGTATSDIYANTV
jgi:hypothetical protein